MMSNRMSRRDSFRDIVTNRRVSRLKEEESKRLAGLYSYRKGLFYSIFLTFLLWWIPILGPAVAGYVSGRRSGDSYKAIQASLITVAIVVLFTFALLPFKSGPLAAGAVYLNQGVLALSSSKLAAASNLLTDMYTTYGLVKTFAIILPSSIITLLAFSYVGGSISYLKSSEEQMGLSYNRKMDIETFRQTRNQPSVRVTERRTTGIREYVPTEYSTDDDGVPFSSL